MISGCSTRLITIESNPGSTISLVSPASIDSVGELVGKDKAELKVDKIGNKFIKISAPKKIDQIIVITDSLGANTKFNIALKDFPEPEKSAQQPNNDPPKSEPKSKDKNDEKKAEAQDYKLINLSSRLLLRSYQALVKGNFNQAIDLADKLSQISPRAAAPHIITGLSALKQGNKNLAQSSFSKAKALDPEDTDLDKLLELSK